MNRGWEFHKTSIALENSTGGVVAAATTGVASALIYYVADEPKKQTEVCARAAQILSFRPRIRSGVTDPESRLHGLCRIRWMLNQVQHDRYDGSADFNWMPDRGPA